MPWSGATFTRTNGVFTGSIVWQSDRDALVKIRADRHDTHDQDLAGGINACLKKDGGNGPTANIGWNNFRITGLANGAANQDAATFGQTVTAASWDAGTNTLTLTRAAGNITAVVSGFLDLTGGTVTGDLLVTGADDATPFEIRREGASSDQVSMRFSTSLGSNRFFGVFGNDPFWAGTSNLSAGSRIWHQTNDGAGSGLDADLLDGLESTVFVQTTRAIIAGNGLTGDGTLAADVTLNMGTPSTVTGATTNIATPSSHTHAVSLTAADVGAPPTSRTLTAGNGLTGGGDLSANRTFTMGTPTTLTPSTANAVTATSHTHAITGFAELAAANTFTSNQTISNGTDSRLALFSGGSLAGSLRADGSNMILSAEGQAILLRPNGVTSAINQAAYGVTGNFIIAGTGTGTNWAVTSDERLKENLQPFAPRDFEVQLYAFDWKSGGSGLSPTAQDVQKVAPEYVHEAEDGTLGLDKAGLALELVLALVKRVDVITYRVDRLVSLIGD